MHKKTILLLILLVNSLGAITQTFGNRNQGFAHESWIIDDRWAKFQNYYFPTDNTFIKEDIYSGGIYWRRKYEGTYVYDPISETIKFSTDKSLYKVTFQGDTAVSLQKIRFLDNQQEIGNMRFEVFNGSYRRRIKGSLSDQTWECRLGFVYNRFRIGMDGTIRYNYSDNERSLELEGAYRYADNTLFLNLTKIRDEEGKPKKLKYSIETKLPIEIIGDSFLKVRNLSSIMNMVDSKDKSNVIPYSNDISLMRILIR